MSKTFNIINSTRTIAIVMVVIIIIAIIICIVIIIVNFVRLRRVGSSSFVWVRLSALDFGTEVLTDLFDWIRGRKIEISLEFPPDFRSSWSFYQQFITSLVHAVVYVVGGNIRGLTQKIVSRIFELSAVQMYGSCKPNQLKSVQNSANR